jgi:hypothetical protein
MDNATAEHTFVTTFFMPGTSSQEIKDSGSSLLSPVAMSAPRGVSERRSTGSESEGQTLRGNIIADANIAVAKENQSNLGTIWRQIFDPVLEYTQVYQTLRRS